MSALLPGEGEIPPPIPLAEIRDARPDVRLVREMRGGRLTFKYTRLDARWVLAALERGKTESYVVEGYGLEPAAVHELIDLAAQNERDVFERTVIGPAART